MIKKKQIIALTTDPYGNIQGYALVFIRLFDFIQKKNPDLGVVLISNDGVCSDKVGNTGFVRISLDPSSSLGLKALKLTRAFIGKAKFYGNHDSDMESIIVANSEIPELLAALFLKSKFEKVYCMVHDLRLRDGSLKTRLIGRLRLFLIYRIKKVLFVNRYTMDQLDDSVTKFYVGNPVFQ